MIYQRQVINLIASRYFKQRLLRKREKEDKQKQKLETKCRQVYDRMNPKESCWWKFLQIDTIKDPYHRDGKLFRDRFRVPYDVYCRIIHLIKAEHPLMFKAGKPKDIAGRLTCPLELKVLGVLRVLGRASTFDCIGELTNTHREIHRLFFHKFTAAFSSSEIYDTYVNGPSSEEEIKKVSISI